MYEILRRKGTIHDTMTIVVDTSIVSFEEFDRVLKSPVDRPNKWEYQEDLNGEAEEQYTPVLNIYLN